MSKALDDVKAERQRQIEVEGWTAEHDDEHDDKQLAFAGAAYALRAGTGEMYGSRPSCWPWSRYWWKPEDDRRNLVKAAALLVAEIERLDRLEGSE